MFVFYIFKPLQLQISFMIQKDKTQNQAVIDPSIKREKVDPKTPLNSTVGRVKAEFKQDMSNKSSTGILIGLNIILTVAHGITNEKKKVFADKTNQQKIIASQIYFQLPHLENKFKVFKVIDYWINPQYFNNQSLEHAQFDIALLIIQPIQQMADQTFMKLNFEYDFQRNSDKIVYIAGYAHNQDQLKVSQSRINKKENGQLQYNHSTLPGCSGGPIYLKLKELYEIIGVHKGTHIYQKYNFGIFLPVLQNIIQQSLSEFIEKHKLEQILCKIYKKSMRKLQEQNSILLQQNTILKTKIDNIQNQLNQIITQKGKNQISMMNQISRLKNQNLNYKIKIKKLEKTCQNWQKNKESNYLSLHKVIRTNQIKYKNKQQIENLQQNKFKFIQNQDKNSKTKRNNFFIQKQSTNKHRYYKNTVNQSLETSQKLRLSFGPYLSCNKRTHKINYPNKQIQKHSKTIQIKKSNIQDFSGPNIQYTSIQQLVNKQINVFHAKIQKLKKAYPSFLNDLKINPQNLGLSDQQFILQIRSFKYIDIQQFFSNMGIDFEKLSIICLIDCNIDNLKWKKIVNHSNKIPNLKVLILKHNMIQSISLQDLLQFKKLKYIGLSENHLSNRTILNIRKYKIQFKDTIIWITNFKEYRQEEIKINS